MSKRKSRSGETVYRFKVRFEYEVEVKIDQHGRASCSVEPQDEWKCHVKENDFGTLWTEKVFPSVFN